MTNETVYLTEEGAEDLRRELQNLVEVRRPELAVKLKEAVSMGDLKENADYHDAKEQQAFVEGRIQYLENLLKNAEIINTEGPSDEVRVGSSVTIREKGSDEDETYTIVGPAEANPSEGRISMKSPIGSALIGRKKGDKIKVDTPEGKVTFKLVKIN